jgi:hypothetical protein
VGIHPDSRNSDDPWLIPEVPMNEVLRVLQVEGSILDASSSERALAKAGYSLHCERVVNAAEMRAALARSRGMSSSRTIACRSSMHPPRCYCCTRAAKTSHSSSYRERSAKSWRLAIMKSGAQDYLVKDDLARLAPAVERELRDARTRQETVAGAGRAAAERGTRGRAARHA